MAKAQGVSKATVNRIWQSHQIKPHRTKGFKLSRDPNFLQKLLAGRNVQLEGSPGRRGQPVNLLQQFARAPA